MTLIEQLTRLAEIAPEVCVTIRPRYRIGEYSFGSHLDGSIYAKIGGIEVSGRPALAWLRDALEGVIEARGWYFQLESYRGVRGVSFQAKITGKRRQYKVATSAELALLIALLAALEGEG